MLHIAFSYYLFDTMKNVNSALVELNIGSKKKPSLPQQFTIFRYKSAIENHVKVESTQAKDIYMQLTNVTEFEKLLGECQKAIEKVSNFQIEFWSQIANQLPDLNILHDLGNKIYDATKEAEDFWNKLCKINPNYSKALVLYGNYMVEIKNHNQVGYELLEKAKTNTNKKSLDDLIKSSDILFADDTVVLHISGTKETGGKILKTNQGLTKIFGYSKTEVMGHFVNILMPTIFAKRHNEFLEKFFKTGHKTVFNTERHFFGLHRNGFCFCIKMLVKQMPSLYEGIQYVGMIRQSQGDCDYILTDMRGVIDSFSNGVTSLLNLPASIFKDADINIQILAPELIKIFSSADKKKALLNKFQESGGQKLTFVVPKEFTTNAQLENKKNARDIGKGTHSRSSNANTQMKKTKVPLYRDLNKDLNKHGGITSKQITTHMLLQSQEYKECEHKQTIKCEIQDPIYGEEHKDLDPLKIRVFKITGINIKRAGSAGDPSSEGEDVSAGIGVAHSNASWEWKESNRPIPEDIGKEEEKQGLINLMENNLPEKRKSEEKKIEPESQQKREETKTTERMPGNTLTTEGRAETLEAKPVLRVKHAADPKTGEIHRTTKEVMLLNQAGNNEDKKEPREEMKSIQPIRGNEQEMVPLLNKMGNENASNLKEDKKEEKVSEKKDEKKDEKKEEKKEIKKEEKKVEDQNGEETPRMELGNLKGPEFAAAGSHIAEENTVNPHDQSLSESDSHKSTGRVGVKEEKKEEAKKEVLKNKSCKSASKILDEAKDSKRNSALTVGDRASLKDKKWKDSDENESSKSNPKIDEEMKEDPEESQEEVVPLDSVKIDLKLAEEKRAKVPSILEDVMGGVSQKMTPEEKKLAQKDKQKQDEDYPAEKKLTLGKLTSEADAQKSTERKVPLDTKDAAAAEEEDISLAKRKISQDSEKQRDYIAKKTPQDDPSNKKVLPLQNRSLKNRKKVMSKIISNQVLEGDGKEMEDFPEYKPSDEEMKVRRALLAFEKKKNKEKKKTDKDNDKKEETKKGDEEKEEGKEDVKEEDKDEDEDEEKEDKKATMQKQVDDDADENQDTQSSVTSGSTGSTMRSFYSLRAAIDEKYIPLSIRNMSCSANIVFLLLLGLAIVYFVMQITLYDKINQNIKNINYSEQRVNGLIDINLQVTTMMLVTSDYNQHKKNAALAQTSSFLYDSFNVTNGWFEEARTKLKMEATMLKDAQTDLSLKSTQLSEASLAKINPSNVVLSYKNVPGMPATYNYTIWQAIMEIVVSSYRIATMNISQVDDNDDATVYFVTKNSLNNVIINLDISSGAIMDEIESTREFNVIIFLILLCVASFALVLSTVLLVPVINKVKKNKQEVLELFMHIKKQDANEELNKCRKFLGTFQANQETEMIAAEGEEGQQEGGEEGEGDATTGRLKKIGGNRGYTSRRKFKRLVLNLGIVLFKFIFLILVMEGYFIMSFFLSSTFLDRVSSLTGELNQLICRLPTHSLLLLIEKLVIFKNFNLTIKNQNSNTYITNYQNQLYDGEEKLLDMFSKNYDYHSGQYNRDFNNIVFSDVCQYIPEFAASLVECQSFYQGILKKGIYSSVIKYWDYLRQLNHDFTQSAKTSNDQYRYLNDAGLNTASIMQSRYLNISLNTLVNKLSADIDTFFSKELNQNQILFSVYIIYLVVVYLFFWRGFISEMQEELWKTKSVLSILSPEIIMSITEIKTFILNNSSTVFFSKSTHK